MRKRLYRKSDLYERDGGLPIREVDFLLRVGKMPQIKVLLNGLEDTADMYEETLTLMENLEERLKQARELTLKMEHDNGLYYHDLQILTKWYRDAGA